MAKKKEKPLTRKDVLKAIEKNGGTAEGLDLSHCRFEEGIDLSGLDLHKIILNDTHLFRAIFNGSNLYGANFDNANLQYAKFNSLNSEPTNLYLAQLKGAHLENAEFRNADLSGVEFYGSVKKSYTIAHLDNTDLRGAKLFLAKFKPCFFYSTKLEGAFLHGADIKSALHLDEADWGSYIIGEEKSGDFYSAVHYYRQLKIWYTNAGMHDIAAKFYYREKEANRKSLKLCSKKNWNNRLAAEFMRAFFGYGEEWKRIFGWIAAVVFGLAGVYHLWGSFSSSSFLDTLYYSAASFTALGYGNWAPQPTGWAKGMGAAEAVVGVSMMALLLVTFVRKWTR